MVPEPILPSGPPPCQSPSSRSSGPIRPSSATPTASARRPGPTVVGSRPQGPSCTSRPSSGRCSPCSLPCRVRPDPDVVRGREVRGPLPGGRLRRPATTEPPGGGGPTPGATDSTTRPVGGRPSRAQTSHQRPRSCPDPAEVPTTRPLLPIVSGSFRGGSGTLVGPRGRTDRFGS